MNNTIKATVAISTGGGRWNTRFWGERELAITQTAPNLGIVEFNGKTYQASRNLANPNLWHINIGHDKVA
jgi:hypothetical protein